MAIHKGEKKQTFTIIAGGSPRLLFRVEERASTDLTTIIRPAKFASLSAHAEPKLDEIKEQHISVHNSHNSETQINAITIKTLLLSAKTPNVYHYTAAMKQYSNYAPIFTQRCPNLNHPQFESKIDGNKFVSLGVYDPALFQVVYQILVSKLRTPKFLGGSRANCLHVDFSNFRITVIWSFLSLSYNRTASSLLLGTIKPEKIQLVEPARLRELAQMIPVGLAPLTCINEYINLRRSFKQQFIDTTITRARNDQHLQSADTLQSFVNFLTIAGEFFREGTATNERYQWHLRKCNMILRHDTVLENLFMNVAKHQNSF